MEKLQAKRTGAAALSDHHRSPFFKPAINSIQRTCAACEKDMQRKETSGATVATASTENYIGSLGNKGTLLTENERRFFEPKFGHDFSAVQLHTNEEANQSARDMNALAYTHGSNIVFNANQYQPGTNEGKRLLAHELTHVVQQSNFPTAKNPVQRQEDKTDDANLQVTKQIELPAPADTLSSVLTSPENKAAEKETPHLGFDFSKSLSPNPPLFPTPETYTFSLVYRDLNLKSFGEDDAPFGVDIGHEPNVQLTLSPDPHNAQIYQAAFTLINLHFRRNKNEFIELGLGPQLNYAQPSATLSGGAQLQAEWHVTSTFSLTASSAIGASKHDDKSPVDYSTISLGTARGLDWSWNPISVGALWHFR